MHELLRMLSDIAVPAIELMALTVIVIGTVEAFARTLRALFTGSANGNLFRPIWLRYALWLIGGLTFLLAADIIATSSAPSWDDVGKLGAIAIIRTFLNHFLARDQRELLADAPRETKA